MFSWFGHQSRFVLPTIVVCITGHFPAASSVFASMSLSKRSSAFPVRYTLIINALIVTQVSATTSAVTLKCAERGALHNLPVELTTEATRSSRTPGVGELAALRRGFAVDSIRRYTDELRAHPLGRAPPRPSILPCRR